LVMAQIAKKTIALATPTIGGHNKRIKPPSPGSEPVGMFAIRNDKNVAIPIIESPTYIFMSSSSHRGSLL